MPTSEPLLRRHVRRVVDQRRVPHRNSGSRVPGTYVVFGLGKYSAMSGANGNARYLQETPVAYNPSANSGPDTVYCRFGLVFQVDPVNGTPATFIGAVEFETDRRDDARRQSDAQRPDTMSWALRHNNVSGTLRVPLRSGGTRSVPDTMRYPARRAKREGAGYMKRHGLTLLELAWC